MHTFDPALLAEIAYRREDVRTSFLRTRRHGVRTAGWRAPSRRRAPRTVAARSAVVTGAVTHRAA